MTILQCTSLSSTMAGGESCEGPGGRVPLLEGQLHGHHRPQRLRANPPCCICWGDLTGHRRQRQFRDKDLYRLQDDQLAISSGGGSSAFVFQSYNLVRELTGMENILLPLMLDKRSPDEAYLNRLIDILGIGSRRNHLPSAMSGGQQQRFAIARALANKPEILFADEPTGNLDGQTGRMVLELLRELNRELGITLVLVTHDLGVAEQAQRVIHLTDGKIARDSGGVQL